MPRRSYLADVVRAGDIRQTPLGDDGREQRPDHQPDGHHRKIVAEFLAKQGAVDHSQSPNHHPHADGQPQGPELGARVALPDLKPSQQGPETPRTQAVQKIDNGEAE